MGTARSCHSWSAHLGGSRPLRSHKSSSVSPPAHTWCSQRAFPREVERPHSFSARTSPHPIRLRFRHRVRNVRRDHRGHHLEGPCSHAPRHGLKRTGTALLATIVTIGSGHDRCHGGSDRLSTVFLHLKNRTLRSVPCGRHWLLESRPTGRPPRPQLEG